MSMNTTLPAPLTIDRVRDIILAIAHQRPPKRRVDTECSTLIAALLDEVAGDGAVDRRQAAILITEYLPAWVNAIEGMRHVASNS